MRVAIISDIHANLTALEAVALDWGVVDAIWCAGDTVGYGPDPVACIEFLRDVSATSVAGNHDWAAIGRLGIDSFNDVARAALIWTAQKLDDTARDWLANLPLLQGSDYLLVHGSPRDPLEEYLLSSDQAAANFRLFPGRACFIGHSHIPLAYSIADDPLASSSCVRSEAVTYHAMPLDHRRYIINVGSVGQPRDGDPAARYVVLDTTNGTYERRRVEYDLTATQERMKQARLPTFLIRRLALGR